MGTKCQRCGLEKDMKSHNFYFETHNTYYYVCDDCRVIELRKQLLNALSNCNQIVNIKAIDIFLAEVLKNEKES